MYLKVKIKILNKIYIIKSKNKKPEYIMQTKR